MRLSTKGRYGVLAMYELARRYGDGPISIKEIAAIQDFSNAYMEQLFSALKKSGLIKSLRGARGGYQLSRPPAEITVGQIIDALEGPIELAECVGGPEGFVCKKSADCVTRGLWMEVQDSIRGIIDHRTLEDLLIQSGAVLPVED
ncbi:MAG: Rrf2 family transcriptional regulator [Eubacterium aggregans]|uniref:Rrf2 family protein n=1 Tax=Eubacterium aggregans TaxID=81409 RepID=A0A1H4BUR6_9FIRM|nr:Rrf2 family transcriptional regulator [Eubacterium aggregans]MDD4691459.1 Rrf2 family transcriptional regulator [Eubacterium aggregans]MEA5073871.1 Rrf2 family transcriptional regulator [Eubacterium aggregans]SEA51807.1 Rrf2 family protein [Eubacterium aggregans]